MVYDYDITVIGAGPGGYVAAIAAAGEGKKVCIVEDVVTTGGQILLSVKDIRGAGAHAAHVICVIQRNANASEILAAEGLELRPLFTMEYIKSVSF